MNIFTAARERLSTVITLDDAEIFATIVARVVTVQS